MPVLLRILGLVTLAVSQTLQSSAGEVLERRIPDGRLSRPYLLYVPDGYDDSSPWPLVIVYHGYSRSGRYMMNEGQMNGHANEKNFLVAYPDGRTVTDVILNNSATGWNVPGEYTASHDDIEFTESVIEDIGQDFNLDRGRIHVAGMSNGANMAFYVACVLADKIASVAGVGGHLTRELLETCQPIRPISILSVMGTDDRYLPVNGTADFPPIAATAQFFASFNGCAAEPVVTPLPNIVTSDDSNVLLWDYASCDPNAEVLFYRVIGGGHTWPGGLTPAFFGTTNEDFEASEVMLEFFARNPLPENTNEFFNISTRGLVADGADIMIGGFVITGESSGSSVLVRGIGPTLGDFGVTNHLEDPVIEVYQAHSDGNSTLIALNDDWGEHPSLSATAERVGAFALSADSKDAAVLLTGLEPGSYTVHMSGKSDSAQVGLIEIYRVF